MKFDLHNLPFLYGQGSPPSTRGSGTGSAGCLCGGLYVIDDFFDRDGLSRKWWETAPVGGIEPDCFKSSPDPKYDHIFNQGNPCCQEEMYPNKDCCPDWTVPYTNRFVFMAHGDNGLFPFFVNDDGKLTGMQFKNSRRDDASHGGHYPDGSSVSGSSLGVWGDGNFVYVAQGSGGLSVFSFNAGAAERRDVLTFVDSHDPGTENGMTGGVNVAYDVWGDGNFIYVASEGLHVYSVDGSGHLTYESYIDEWFDSFINAYPSVATSVWGDGNFIYVGLCELGYAYVTTLGGTHASSVHTAGIVSLSVDGSGNLTKKDSDRPFVPGYGGEFNHYQDGGAPAAGVWGDDDFVYFACGSAGLHSYSVDANGYFTHHDSANPSDDFVNDVWGDGNYLYLACGNSTSDDGAGNEIHDGNGGLYTYTVDRSATSTRGDLTYVASHQPVNPDVGSGSITRSYFTEIWGDGDFIYAVGNKGSWHLNGMNGLFVYSVDGAGNLSPLPSSYPAPLGPALDTEDSRGSVYMGPDVGGYGIGVWAQPATDRIDASDFMNDLWKCTQVCAGNYQPDRFTDPGQHQTYCPATPSGFSKAAWGFTMRSTADDCGDFFTQTGQGPPPTPYWYYPEDSTLDWDVLKSPDHWNYIYQNPKSKCLDFRTWTFTETEATEGAVAAGRILSMAERRRQAVKDSSASTIGAYIENFGYKALNHCCRYPQTTFPPFNFLPVMATCYYDALNLEKSKALEREYGFEGEGGCMTCQIMQIIGGRPKEDAVCWAWTDHGGVIRRHNKRVDCGYFGLDHWYQGWVNTIAMRYHPSWSNSFTSWNQWGSDTWTLPGFRPATYVLWQPCEGTTSAEINSCRTSPLRDLCINQWWDCEAQVLVRGCRWPSDQSAFWNIFDTTVIWSTGGGSNPFGSPIAFAKSPMSSTPWNISQAGLTTLDPRFGTQQEMGCLFTHRECFTNVFAPWSADVLTYSTGPNPWNKGREFAVNVCAGRHAEETPGCHDLGGILGPGSLSATYQKKAIIFVPLPPSGYKGSDINGCPVIAESGNNYRFRYDHITWDLKPFNDPRRGNTVYECDDPTIDVTRHEHWILEKGRRETRTFMAFSGNIDALILKHGTGVFCTGFEIPLPSEMSDSNSWNGFAEMRDWCGIKHLMDNRSCVYQRLDNGTLYKATTCIGPFHSDTKIVVDYYKDHDYIAQTNWICLKDSFVTTLPKENHPASYVTQIVAAGSKVIATRPFSQFRSKLFAENSTKNYWYKNYYYMFDDTISTNPITNLYYQYDGMQHDLSYCQCNPIRTTV